MVVEGKPLYATTKLLYKDSNLHLESLFNLQDYLSGKATKIVYVIFIFFENKNLNSGLSLYRPNSNFIGIVASELPMCYPLSKPKVHLW